jgi:hypothetical protein
VGIWGRSPLSVVVDKEGFPEKELVR